MIKSLAAKKGYYLLFTLVLAVFLAMPALATKDSTTASQQMVDGWQRAEAIGRFHFETTARQTTHPTALPANIGRTARTENFAIAGDIDQDAHEALLQFWPNGQQLAQSMTLKVEDGRTYGRADEKSAWVEVEDAANIFIQNSQPMSFLYAAENVRELNDQEAGVLFPGQMLPEELQSTITCYRFDLNGLKYAQFMKRTMEEELRRRGELPAGISLGMVQEYVDMTGEGELWLDARGLPYRQIVHVQFPAGENDLEWLESQITTNYSSWQPHILDVSALDWSKPAAALASVMLVVGVDPAGGLQVLIVIAYILLILGAVALLFGRYAKQARAVFSLAIIAAMLLGPLLQVREAAAFFERQETRSAALQPPQTAEVETTEKFQPNKDPLLASRRDPVRDQQASLGAAANTLAPVQPQRITQASACTVTETSDCDQDGLTDKVEIFELGTFADQVDTDSDGISDNLEVVGFSVGGETWYLNPRDPDSNKDGLPDGLECSSRYNINEDGSINSSVTAVTCKDTDKDGVPDVWDYDNDKDGVPDTVDSDPQTYYTVANEQFGLTLAGYEEEKPLFVDVTIRPTDEGHLWWTNNYLDWPDLDQAGQIMRVTTETLSTDGDIMLSPILEITIPFDSANPSRSLPVKANVNAANISQTDPIADWLDTDTLAFYNLSASQDEDSGTIVLFAPLTLTKDIVGETPVAWSTQIYYKLAAASSAWGHDHEMRLLWTVNGIVDHCTIPEGETWASYCDVGSQRENSTNLSHWTSSQTVLQTYYDDFIVTSLSVREEHSVDAAVIAQKMNASGASSHYENYLWHLAETLEETFLGAQLVGGQRFSVADIASNFPNWGIPSDALYFNHLSTLKNTTDLQAALSGDQVITLLNDAYPASTKPAKTNLLFVGDKTFRTIGLDEESIANATNAPSSFLTLDLTGKGTVTTGFMRWSPYSYNGTTWSNLELSSYLDGLGSDLKSVFTQAQIANLTGSSGDYEFNDAQGGAINLAENFYTALYTGAINLLADGSTIVSSGTLNNNAHSLPSETAVSIVGELLGDIQDYYTRISLSNLTLTATLYAELETVATSAWSALASSTGLILAALGQVVEGGTSSSSTIALHQLQYAPQISGNLSKLLNAGALDYTYKSTIGTAESYGKKATYGADLYYGSYRGLYKAYSAYKYFNGYEPSVSRILSRFVKDYETELFLGYALQVGTAIGSFALAWASGKISPGSPEFAQKLAFEISRIIVDTVVLVLTIATGGLFLGVMAIVAVIDSLAAIICEAVGVKPGSELDQWVCGGLTGALVKAITYVINDYTPLVDLTNNNRLDSSMGQPTITQNADTPGFSTGNTINITAFITNTLYFGHPNWMGYAYAPIQLTDPNLEEATFKYELQTTPADINLDLNGTNWNFVGGAGTDNSIPSGPRFRQKFAAPVSYTVAADEAGINVGLGVYLAEGFAMNAQDCWLILFVPTCLLEQYNDTNQTDLSNDLIFDIFPETLEEFHDLTLVSQKSYQLSWDGSFPTLVDADGDGLSSKWAGGADPDDSNPDSDGDGLSDGFEQNNNFDNTTADGDKDGLTDYWEAFFLTNPYKADSDGDGLLDSEEAFHPNWIYPYENSALSDRNAPPNAPSHDNYAGGWEIVYGFNGSTPLKSWVSASPVDPDTDDDAINDLREEIYGYNPLAASTLHVLGLHSEVQAVKGSSTYPVPYATLDSTLNYTADVTNELTDRWALGLLQTEYPVDHVRATQELGTLQPLGSTSLSGSISAGSGGLSASGTTSLTVRSGAIIEGDNDRVLWLRLNEAAGSETFADSSVYQHDGICYIVTNVEKCPTANGSYLQFNPANGGQDPLWIPGGDYLPPANFSLGMWVRVDTNGIIRFIDIEDGIQTINNFTLLSDDRSLKVQARNGTFDTGYDLVFGRWTHILVTYADSSRLMTVYVDGVQKWSGVTADLRAGSDGSQIIGDGSNGSSFAIDEVELFNRVLTSTEIKALYGLPVLDIEFLPALQDTSPGDNALSCANTRCPTAVSAGAQSSQAYFNQSQNVAASGPALNFSGDAFTFSMWMKPETRSTPFDTAAVSAFNNLDGAPPRVADTNFDWQAIFGAVDSSNLKKIAPTLFVNPAGQMRMFMGNGSSICHVDTAEGLIEYGSWQYVTVSYDGEVFTFYINGHEVAQSTNACAAITPPNLGKLQIGRFSDLGTLYFNNVFIYGGDVSGSSGNFQLRINLDNDTSTGNIWSDDSLKSIDYESQAIDFAYYIPNDSDHWFRFWEDDSIPNNNSYDTCNAGCDDSLVNENISNITLGSNTTSFQYHETIGNDSDTGNLKWSISNDSYQGYLDGFKAFTRAFSDEDALKLYEASYNGLYFNFDEPPGDNFFTDAYDGNVIASCDYGAGTCPDSGVPGIANQAADFQGGVDYLQLPEIDLLKTLNSGFTIGAWINPESFSTWQRIFAADRTNSDNGFGFGLKNSNLAFTTYGVKDYISTATVKAGEWQHVAVVFDSNFDASFYLNGVFVDKISGSAASKSNTDDPYRIGASALPGGSGDIFAAFDGRIDDLFVETRALDQAAIQGMMADAPLLNLHLDEDLYTTSFTDDSLTGNSAICSGSACPAAGDKGQIREAVVFDGIDDILTIPANPNLALSEFTVGLWVNPTEIKSDYQPLIVKENATGGERNFGLFIHPDNMAIHMSMGISDCTTNAAVTAWNDPLLQHQWNHIMYTFDGSIQKLYINGTFRRSYNYAGSPCLAEQPIKIGNEVNHFVPFSGSIDEVTIRDRALSALEIAEIFAYQSAWFDVKETHTITIDADNPTISLDQETGYVAPGETIVKIAAQDPTSEITEVVYQIPGGSVEQATNTNGVWTLLFNRTVEGPYLIALRATDSVGHMHDTAANLTVDATPPAGSAGTIPHKPTNGVITWDSIIVNDELSGVDSSTVFVTIRDRHGNVVGAPVLAEPLPNSACGCQYTADLPFTHNPYGNYTFTISFKDNVGNLGSYTQGAVLENLGPHADVMLHATSNITPGMTLRGMASDIEHIWQSRSMQLHFEEDGGSTSFLDNSANEFLANCATSTTCPMSGVSGKYESAVSFDGSNDYLVVEDNAALIDTSSINTPLEERLGINDTSFTVMAWVNGSSWSGDRPLLATDPSADDQAFFVGFDNGKPVLRYDGQVTVLTGALPANEWKHVTWRYDDDSGEQSIFIDGALLTTQENRSAYTGDNHAVYIGRAAPTAHFAGMIDELVVYRLALSDDRIHDIASPVDSGLSKIEIRFRHIDDNTGQIEDSGTWYEATFDSGAVDDIFRTWNFTVPSGLNGSYKIDLRATDSFGVVGQETLTSLNGDPLPHNKRFIPGVWTGIIGDPHHGPVDNDVFMPVIGGRP